jgi:hypothetical protein
VKIVQGPRKLIQDYLNMLELSKGVTSEESEASKFEVPSPNFTTLGCGLPSFVFDHCEDGPLSQSGRGGQNGGYGPGELEHSKTPLLNSESQ